MLKYVFWGLLVLMGSVFCFKIRNEETTTAVLFLENNGELVDATGIPNCGSQYIILKSYEYKLMQCSRISCTSVHTEALSEATVFQLYKKCSFRHFCEKLHFPVPASLQNRLEVIVPALHAAVNIQYQCIGDGIAQLNMCEKYEVNFNDRLHLIFNSHAKSFKECQCWVNKGKFSLIIMDLRLNMRNKDQCADTKLVINKDHYLCNASSDSYGAIFGETFKFNADLPPDALISLVSDSGTPPEMVWIELIPEGTSRLECLGDRTTSLKSTKLVPVPTTKTRLISSMVVSTSDTMRARVKTGYNDKISEKVTTTTTTPESQKSCPTCKCDCKENNTYIILGAKSHVEGTPQDTVIEEVENVDVQPVPKYIPVRSEDQIYTASVLAIATVVSIVVALLVGFLIGYRVCLCRNNTRNVYTVETISMNKALEQTLDE